MQAIKIIRLSHRYLLISYSSLKTLFVKMSEQLWQCAAALADFKLFKKL